MKNSYLFKSIFFFLLLFLAKSTIAQDFLPTLNDNYMGINQVTLQPASIVDSRFKIDVNLFGINSDVYNNMIRFQSQAVLSPFGIINDDTWWEDNTYLSDANGDDKNAFMSQTVLGPSFLINLTPKHAIGFTYKFRNIVNVDGIGEPLARSIYRDFQDPDYWNTWYHDEDIRAINHVFADYGLTYATEIFNNGTNYLKTGITVKLLQGLGGANVQTEDFYYYFYEQDNNGLEADYMSWNSPYVHSAVSDNWNWGTKPINGFPEKLSYSFIGKPSIGLDLGLVYEFRPKYKEYRYDMDGEKDIERADLNKYLLKIGVSIVDIGRIRYEKFYNSQDFSAAFTPDYLARYEGGNNAVPTNTYWMDIEEVSFGLPPYVNFADTMYNRIPDHGASTVVGNEEDYIIKLPTALSLQADVNIVKGLYVNLTTYTALHQSYSTTGNSHYMSNYSITPRYEHKWFSVMLPVQYNQFKKVNVGLGIRAAFIYFGVNNLISTLFDDPYGTSVYLGVKIPIWQNKPPADMDQDGVSDAKDNCPSAPGPWELMGCPDKDGDGITDSDDQCPDVAGPKVTNGCPDRDGDGIIDLKDECPDIVGPAQYNGCPDRDGDGLVDIKDNCPDLAGPVELGGCPILDSDGDGIKDTDDACPEIKGPPENNGCPYSDTDQDGVIDKDDRCPLTPGDLANFGCPVVKAEEEAVLKTAFESLEFETGKNVIRSSSFASLDQLAALLISKPTWKLKIAGHTDDVGSEESNMTLSKNRTQATAKYLQGKGVPEKQLIMEWFGETKPIADNSTPEGRQINRRVDMQVVFD